MRRSGHSNLPVLAVVAFLPLASSQPLARENGQWVRTISGSVPATARLRVNAHGPVTLEGGASRNLTYTVKITVSMRAVRTEAEGDGTI